MESDAIHLLIFPERTSRFLYSSKIISATLFFNSENLERPRMEMITIDPQAAMKLQPELSASERIQWAGSPNPGVIFHSDDWFIIPFSFLWGGFAIFWEASDLGIWETHAKSHPISWFMAFWGFPFVVIGQYMIWSRFFWDAWLKRRTYYAVTNRRVLILQEG